MVTASTVEGFGEGRDVSGHVGAYVDGGVELAALEHRQLLVAVRAQLLYAAKGGVVAWAAMQQGDLVSADDGGLGDGAPDELGATDKQNAHPSTLVTDARGGISRAWDVQPRDLQTKQPGEVTVGGCVAKVAHVSGRWRMQRITSRLLGGRAPTVAAATVLTALTVNVMPLPAQAALSPDDDFQVPFACGESWEGGTRPSHSPSSLAVDWNRDSNDLGQLVIASAPGVVESVKNLGDSSYGLYVVIDHGGGWTTLHAHLLSSFVVPGQRIDQGQAIGQVGSSGSSSGPHLHYEQRLNRTDTHARFDGTSFEYDSWIDSRNCPDVPVVGDWNGDRVSDVGTFSRRPSGGVLRQRLPGAVRRSQPWGKSTDQPLVGDWDGDGQFEPGVFRQARQRFILAMPQAKPLRVRFGDARDWAIAGDWDGDGRWDVGTFNAGTTTFSLRNADGYVSTKIFGSVSSLPVTGDWDGDGRWGVGTYDPATATFRLDLGAGSTKTIVFGNRNSLPVIGMWNPDAVSDVGVWNPSTGVFSERLGPNRTRTIRFGHRR